MIHNVDSELSCKITKTTCSLILYIIMWFTGFKDIGWFGNIKTNYEEELNLIR